MDRSWMQLNKSNSSFAERVEEFINFVYSKKESHEKIPCPCYACNNFCDQTQEVVRYHLSINGIKRSYIKWVYHGETSKDESNNEGSTENNIDINELDDDCNVDGMLDMLNGFSNAYLGENLGREETTASPGAPFPLGRADTFFKLLKDSEEKLYEGCESYSKLTFLVKLLHLKTISGWTNKSFDMLLELLKEAFQGVDVDLPKSKRLMHDLGPKGPRNDIDVNLQQLISELKELWEVDNKRARKDMMDKGLKPNLHSQGEGEDMPPDSYTLSHDQKNILKLCSKTLYLDVLDKMEKQMALTMCKLERIFPPAFLDVMVHLMIHLASEAKLTGPVQYRWMFPRNYDIGEQLGNLSLFACKGHPFGGPSEHIAELVAESEISVEQQHDLHFPRWFRKRVEQLHSELANDELISLANGPDTRVKHYTGCNINGCRFHTKDRENNKKTQNSGVVVEGEHNKKIIDFYGIVKDIIEMGGPGRRVVGQSEPSSSYGESNIHSQDEIVNSTSTRIKRRGRTRNVALSKRKNANEKLAIQIPEEEKMVELRIERQSAGESLLDEEQICAEVLGYKSGYIRGRGAGPKPKTSFSKQSYREELEDAKRNARIAQHRAIKAEQQVIVFSEQLKNQKSVIEELKEGMLATQRAMIESQSFASEPGLLELLQEVARSCPHTEAFSWQQKLLVHVSVSHLPWDFSREETSKSLCTGSCSKDYEVQYMFVLDFYFRKLDYGNLSKSEKNFYAYIQREKARAKIRNGKLSATKADNLLTVAPKSTITVHKRFGHPDPKSEPQRFSKISSQRTLVQVVRESEDGFPHRLPKIRGDGGFMGSGISGKEEEIGGGDSFRCHGEEEERKHHRSRERKRSTEIKGENKQLGNWIGGPGRIGRRVGPG
ncbi:hypothetical protein Sango_0250700 [Sesamum angolense]|uniref:Transposase-associated domain-containing protein n=1 Tax=Sesamum angolense TaxID=2727404 RepID=A0AAE1XHZ9_9LAMI|nr:hypothetical protein Sango_0250700 [Sesamum angolense]